MRIQRTKVKAPKVKPSRTSINQNKKLKSHFNKDNSNNPLKDKPTPKLPDLSPYKRTLMGSYPHRYYCYNLNDSVNHNLRNQLFEDGFFSFHTSNGLNLVYLHSIIAYYKCGGIHAFKRGFVINGTEWNCHHFDGNTLNNNSDNLIWLPTPVHNQTTRHQRSVHRYLRLFNKQKLFYTDKLVMFNKQGRIVTNPSRFVAQIIVRTVIATFFEFFKKNTLPVSLKELDTWFNHIFRRLQINSDSTFVPTPNLNPDFKDFNE